MNPITPAQIAAATGASLAQALIYGPALCDAMADFGIDTPQRAAAFLANVGHESAKLTRAVENLNYSVEGLRATFGLHRMSAEDALRLGRSLGHPADTAGIANTVYGGAWGAKYLGNTQAGDGAKFIGRGLIQITGRDNYRAMRDQLRARLNLKADVPDLLEQPDALAQPVLAAWSAAAFWNSRGLNSYADRGDFDGTCDLVNLGRKTVEQGDAVGFPERLALFRAGCNALTSWRT